MLRASLSSVFVVSLVASCGPSSTEARSAGVASAGAAGRMACDGITMKAGAKEYCVMKTRRNFEDAQHDCERMRGRLAAFEGDGDDKALFGTIGSPWGYGSGLWLGCSDAEKEDAWTCGGKPMTFKNWAPGKPDSDTALDDCVEWLADSGQWTDAPCAFQLGFLCRGEASLRCPGKKVVVGGGAFCAYAEARDWDAAKKVCAESGGSLATLANAEESRAVFEALKLPSGLPSWEPRHGVWIGLSDVAEEGKFKWTSGAPLRGSNWRSGQPDNMGNEDCVTLTLTDGRWTDFDCGTPLPYVCEAK